MKLYPELNDLLELRHQSRTLGLASFHLVNSTFSGLFASVFRGTGLDFDDVREYCAGDDIRNMDWHITARTGTPHIKVFREERERKVMLCVDNGAHMAFGTRGTFKSIQAARAAALLGWAGSMHNDRVGGVVFGELTQRPRYFRATRGHRALWRLLNHLSQPGNGGQFDREGLVTTLDRVSHGTSTGSLVFVIGVLDHDVASLERSLGILRQKHDVVLLPVDDPADRELPAIGKVLFVDASGEEVEIDTDDEQGRRAYRAAWDGRRSLLRQLANRLGIPVITLTTVEDVHQTITRSLDLRAASRGGG